jgi:hypothetical protein
MVSKAFVPAAYAIGGGIGVVQRATIISLRERQAEGKRRLLDRNFSSRLELVLTATNLSRPLPAHALRATFMP